MSRLSRVNSCVRLNLVEVVLPGIPIYGKSDAEDFVFFYLLYFSFSWLPNRGIEELNRFFGSSGFQSIEI